MLILVDENIPLAAELFGPLGEVRMMSGRDIGEDCPDIERADVLAIRSVTRITPRLVDRAENLRVIGTATIGTDHIDADYICRANRTRRHPITVISAPGSNADSVADYIWHALAHISREDGEPLCSKSLGIIGFGNCGSRVAERAQGFGMRILKYDPPLAERDAGFTSDSFEDALGADFVSLHVPLTRPEESRYPTFHMIGRAELQRMKQSAFLFNSSRGGVVNSPDLIQALRASSVRGAVLDVYEGEPCPPAELISLPLLATPHIAGYAVEAKTRGAVVICEGICRALGLEPLPTDELIAGDLASGPPVEIPFEAGGPPDLCADNAVRALLCETYDIEATSNRLKATLGSPGRGVLFDEQRREYSRAGRHELSAYRVALDGSIRPGLSEGIAARLAGFGIRLTKEVPHFILRPR